MRLDVPRGKITECTANSGTSRRFQRPEYINSRDHFHIRRKRMGIAVSASVGNPRADCGYSFSLRIAVQSSDRAIQSKNPMSASSDRSDAVFSGDSIGIGRRGGPQSSPTMPMIAFWDALGP